MLRKSFLVTHHSSYLYSPQDELMASLEQALTVQDLPEISQTVLNLAEFMEHCDKGPLPLDPVLLGEQVSYNER